MIDCGDVRFQSTLAVAILFLVSACAPNDPHLIVKTDEKIISDHNSIYREHFTNFLRRFYVRHISARINFPRECLSTADGAETGRM